MGTKSLQSKPHDLNVDQKQQMQKDRMDIDDLCQCYDLFTIQGKKCFFKHSSGRGQLFKKTPLKNRKQVKIKLIDDRNWGIGFGIIDQNYRNNRVIVLNDYTHPNILLLWSSGEIWGEGRMKISSQQEGFKNYDIVEVNIVFPSNTVEWIKNGRRIAKHESYLLKNQHINWVAVGWFCREGQIIQWLN